MKYFLSAFLIAVSTTIACGQQQQQSMQDQVCLAYANIGREMARNADVANAQLEILRQQLKAMKDKYEPEKKDAK